MDALSKGHTPLTPRSWRVWSWWTLGIVLAIPVLVAAGFAVWMFVPRTSTRIIPTALYGGTLEGVPIVVEWPPYDPGLFPPKTDIGWVADELPVSVADGGTFFTREAADWRVDVLDHGQRIKITNGSGQELILNRLARHTQRVRASGFSYQLHGRTIKTTVVLPRWNDATHWAVPLLDELGSQPVPEGFESTWDDWDDFYSSWRDGGWSQSGWESHRRISVVFQSPELLSMLDHVWEYTGGAHGNYGTGTHNWYREPTTGRVEPLELEQFFRAEVDWQPRMIEALNSAFNADRARRFEDETPPEHERLTAENLQAPWAITPAGLRFYYPPYELGSYAEGEYVLLIPWANIADLLATDGPAAALRRLIP